MQKHKSARTSLLYLFPTVPFVYRASHRAAGVVHPVSAFSDVIDCVNAESTDFLMILDLLYAWNIRRPDHACSPSFIYIISVFSMIIVLKNLKLCPYEVRYHRQHSRLHFRVARLTCTEVRATQLRRLLSFYINMQHQSRRTKTISHRIKLIHQEKHFAHRNQRYREYVLEYGPYAAG